MKILPVKWVWRVVATRWLHSNDCYGRLLESKDEPQPHTKLNPTCSLIVYNLLSEILPLKFPANVVERLTFKIELMKRSTNQKLWKSGQGALKGFCQVSTLQRGKLAAEARSAQQRSNTVKIARLDKQMLGYFLCSLLISSLSVNFGSKRWRKDGWLTAVWCSKSDNIARFCLNSHLSSVVYTAPLGQPNCWWPINRHFLLAATVACP